jgi:hypothetical protein
VLIATATCAYGQMVSGRLAGARNEAVKVWSGGQAVPVRTVEVDQGQELALGDIHSGSAVRLIPATGSASSVAGFFIEGTKTLHIVHGDGSVVDVPATQDAAGLSATRIAGDGSAMGWLVESDGCCQSYPLALGLRVYPRGKPTREFVGDGRAIFGWNFRAAGKQVAFFQSYPHGDLRTHYELRDVESGRLIDRWDDSDKRKAPAWMTGL